MTAFLILLAAIPAVAFPIVYALTAKWWGSLMGRALMFHASGLALIMSLIVVTTIFGNDYPGRPVVRVATYGVLIGLMWTQFISYIVTVRRVRRQLDQKEHNETEQSS